MDDHCRKGELSSDDSKVSKLLRRLSREDETEKFAALAKQLKEALHQPKENAGYLRRSSEYIKEALVDLLHATPNAGCKLLIAKCIGALGHVLDNDLKRYFDWVFSTYNFQQDDTRLYIMHAIKEILNLDRETFKTKKFHALLMRKLHGALELADSSDLLMCTFDAVLVMTDMYPTIFNKYFRDTVDILVGWHIDSSLDRRVIQYVSSSLQSLGPYWVSDMQFSLTLIGQFLEDMESYGQDINHSCKAFNATPKSAHSVPFSPDQCVTKMTALIKVLNTVLKSLGAHLSPTLAPGVTWNYLSSACSKLLNSVLCALKFLTQNELVIYGNENASLFLSRLKSKAAPITKELCTLIYEELHKINEFSQPAVVSLLGFICKVIQEVSANLPVELVQHILGSKSALLALRFSTSLAVQNGVLNVYHSLLNLKNIPILQEAYRYILGDLERAYRTIVPTIEEICPHNPIEEAKYQYHDVEAVVMFHIKSLADLANSGSSIVAMWALRPNILELFASKLMPYHENLLMYSPTLQYCMLFVLYSHCTRYKHFVSSSCLVKATSVSCEAEGGSRQHASPTSGHLSVVLLLLQRALALQMSSEQTQMLILGWVGEVFALADLYFNILQKAEEFQSLLKALLSCGSSRRESVVRAVLKNLELLLSSKTVWQEWFLSEVLDLCLTHVNSSYDTISSKACFLLTLLPCYIAVKKVQEVEVIKTNTVCSASLQSVRDMQKHYISKITYVGMQGIHFKRFISYLLYGNQNHDTSWMVDTYHSCCPVRPPGPISSENRAAFLVFRHLTSVNNAALMLWLACEAAQFCVASKLRTPLGKPQDTFTSIESTIKQLTQDLKNMLHLSSESNLEITRTQGISNGSCNGEENGHVSVTAKESSVYPLLLSEQVLQKKKNSYVFLQEGPLVGEPSLSQSWEQQRVRLLLEFLEHLEKFIHNASDGCASALAAPPKPVRIFFHANRNTCGEWLSRIRVALVITSFHAGQATSVIRHCHCFLQDLVASKNVLGVDFERIVLYLSWALCKLQEPKAIFGLYRWSQLHGREFPWLKATAEKAAGRFERALEEFKLIGCKLSKGVKNTPDGDNNDDGANVKSFGKLEMERLLTYYITDQLADCYVSLQNWEGFLKWKQEQENSRISSSSVYSAKSVFGNDLYMNQVSVMSCFDENCSLSMSALEKWHNIETEHELLNADKCWNSCILLKYVESTLKTISFRMAMEKKLNQGISSQFSNRCKWIKTSIENCMTVSHRLIQEGLRNNPSEFLLRCIVSHTAASNLFLILQGSLQKNVFFLDDPDANVDDISTSLLTNMLWWNTYFDHMNGNIHQSKVNEMCVHVSKAARKEGNFNLANKLIQRVLRPSGLLGSDYSSRRMSPLEMAKCIESASPIAGKTARVCIPKAYVEVAKLLHCSDQASAAVRLCAVTCLSYNRWSCSFQPDVETKRSETILILTRWLQQKPHLVNGIQEFLPKLFALESANPTKELKVLGCLTSEYCERLLQSGIEVVPATDFIIGHLLYKSLYLSPSLAKAWSQFAEWCYQWGQHTIEASRPHLEVLNDAEKNQIQTLLPACTSKEDLDKVYSILSQRKTEVDENSEIQHVISPEVIEIQLKNLEVLKSTSDNHVSLLMNIWQNIQKRILAYYELSAIAYLKFLELCGDTQGTDCSIISATLRLLRLMVKHSAELQTALDVGLAATPTRLWKGIIPQLFSHLSHNEPFVKRKVSELLCRIAEDSPHLIIFPAVVGAGTGSRRQTIGISAASSRLLEASLSQLSKESNANENDEDSDEHENISPCDDYKDSELRGCFLAMLDVLEKQAPEEIFQVKRLVKELWRITLLWDELWLGSLIQQNAEVVRRLTQLQREIIRVKENLSLDPEEQEKLIEEKHHIILKPLVHLFEQIQTVTSISPETPHEKWFQEKFGCSIKESLESLKRPLNPHRPLDSWQPMKQLQQRLQQRFQKRAAYVIHMSDISPILAHLTHTVIAMPGLTARHGAQVVTIAAVENKVVILPTNTKPKKLVFQGSDGHMYTFLLKGSEDLHLDERIMQFLSITNSMMRSHEKGSSPKRQCYQARHYSVIPLGPRTGLISWVNGSLPLFTLYKRWLQREAAVASLKSASSLTEGPGQVMRPSELFYQKLTPLLKEKGVANADNRKEWPLTALKQVLTELMDETPKDLLAKELWCSSINVGDWWNTIKTCSFSIAVMSMIGYIIGLGDRHLDNILVDLTTGEVIHIDYNVCFEKGKSLRVPEKVPFRLTPNICAALGVTGIEGIFRLASEHVLTVMKRGRDTLLTLLEAFVYDPLIDWRSGNEQYYIGSVYGDQAAALESKQSRQELEREVTQAMFCIRIIEIKFDWITNRDNLSAMFAQLEVDLGKLSELKGQLRVTQELLRETGEQLLLMQEANLNPSHPLYSLHERHSRFLCSKDAMEKVRTALKDKLQDTEKNFNLQKVAFASVRGSQLEQWLSALKYPVHSEIHNAFGLVKEFLQNAGQGHVIVQCEQAATELEHLSQQQHLLVRTCLELLSQYGAVANLYPASHLDTHRIVCYHKWIQLLLDDLTADRCQEVISSFHSVFSSDIKPSLQRVQAVTSYANQLQMAVQDANINFLKALEKVNAKGPPETLSSYEQDYNDCLGALRSFLCSEPGAAFALEGVIVTALCTLNKRYLLMEKAAAGAGDCLVKLTSSDGEWHLDEMQNTCLLLSELCNLLPFSKNQSSGTDLGPNLGTLIQCLTTASNIFKGLKELNVNFQTIILPETLKGFQTEDLTVFSSVKCLEDIIMNCECTIQELTTQMELHLRYYILEFQSPHGAAQTITMDLKHKYEALLHLPGTQSEDSASEEALTPGQMLLMGFNGLFENLQLEISTLGSTVGTISLPAAWRNVDQLKEAEALASPIFDDEARRILESVFLLKRLHTMHSVFNMCRDMVQVEASVYDDDMLHKAVKQFTADFVGQQMLGVTSKICAIVICLLLQRLGIEINEDDQETKWCLEELAQEAIDACVKNGQLDEVTIMQTSSLVSALEAAWQHREQALANQQEVEVQKSAFQRLQLQLTTHYWLYEDVLTPNAASALSRPITRTTFMQEVQSASSGLQALHKCLLEVQSEHNALVHRVEQRLKWGAGANPALVEVAAAFQTSLKRQSDQLHLEQTLATLVNDTCNALLQFEALRTRSVQATAWDHMFLQLVEECEKTCVLASECSKLLSPSELAIINLRTPQKPVDEAWIQSTESLLSDKVKTLQGQIEFLEVDLHAVEESLKKHGGSIRGFLSIHCRMISDVRHFLKLMAKFPMKISSRIGEFLNICKQFSDNSSVLIQDLMKDISLDGVLKTIMLLKCVKENAGIIYSELLEFAGELQSSNMEGNTESNSSSSHTRKQSLWRDIPGGGDAASSKSNVSSSNEETKVEKRAGKVTQERNAYALNVWRRVRMKLEGRDPDARKESSVEEQVDYVIRESMNLDNLALMYEGWTPWV